MRAIDEIKHDLSDARERRDTIRADMDRISPADADGKFSDGQQERLGNLATGFENAKHEVESFEDEWRSAVQEALRTGTLSLEAGSSPPNEGGARGNDRVNDAHLSPQVRASRDAGLRTIEPHADVLSPQASDNLDRLIRHEDPIGVTARYISAVGDPYYSRAF